MLIRLILQNFVVFVAKTFWVFISYTVHRKKLIDMFINNITGVINKNLSLFFFPPDIKLACNAIQKQRELTKKSTFFYFFVFFSKNSGYKKIKNTNFERRSHKSFLGQVLTIFQTSPLTNNFVEKLYLVNYELCVVINNTHFYFPFKE